MKLTLKDTASEAAEVHDVGSDRRFSSLLGKMKTSSIKSLFSMSDDSVEDSANDAYATSLAQQSISIINIIRRPSFMSLIQRSIVINDMTDTITTEAADSSRGEIFYESCEGSPVDSDVTVGLRGCHYSLTGLSHPESLSLIRRPSLLFSLPHNTSVKCVDGINKTQAVESKCAVEETKVSSPSLFDKLRKSFSRNSSKKNKDLDVVLSDSNKENSIPNS
jgi:hypothetical protein